MLPVPPVAAVYQSRFVPVAVSGKAAAFWQYETGEAVGAVLPDEIVTWILALGPSHPLASS